MYDFSVNGSRRNWQLGNIKIIIIWNDTSLSYSHQVMKLEHIIINFIIGTFNIIQVFITM